MQLICLYRSTLPKTRPALPPCGCSLRYKLPELPCSVLATMSLCPCVPKRTRFWPSPWQGAYIGPCNTPRVPHRIAGNSLMLQECEIWHRPYSLPDHPSPHAQPAHENNHPGLPVWHASLCEREVAMKCKTDALHFMSLTPYKQPPHKNFLLPLGSCRSATAPPLAAAAVALWHLVLPYSELAGRQPHSLAPSPSMALGIRIRYPSNTTAIPHQQTSAVIEVPWKKAPQSKESCERESPSTRTIKFGQRFGCTESSPKALLVQCLRATLPMRAKRAVAVPLQPCFQLYVKTKGVMFSTLIDEVRLPIPYSPLETPNLSLPGECSGAPPLPSH